MQLISLLAATSSDGLDLNYRVVFIEDACKGVTVEDIEEQKKKLVENGAIMINTEQVIILNLFNM